MEVESFEDFVKETQCVYSFSTLVKIFCRSMRQHNYDSIVLFRLKAGRLAAMPVAQSNESITNQYFKVGQEQINPVVDHIRQTSEPFFWFDLYRKANLTDEQRKTLRDFERNGAVSGLTIPLPSLEGEQAVICLSNSEANSEARENLPLINAKCMQFWLMLHKLDDGSVVQSDHLLKDILTPRELECLELCLHFESTKSIAHFLERAEQTVQFHISNAIHKLEAQNRTQAVAKACMLGLIGKSLTTS
ncbi:MAG: autoinducer binding domain-containing protein [Pseudomonadota bacterium]